MMNEILMLLGLALGSADPRPLTAEMAAKWMPSLTASLQSPDVTVRRCAARALGRLGPLGKPALSHLSCAAYDCDPQVRRLARQSIELIDPDSLLSSWGEDR